MAKLFLKKKSKRQSTKMRAKITKKVKEHKRKMKREAKKNPPKFKRKDPGIPNSLPFKETILKEVETHKRRRDEEREKMKERQKQEREKLVAKGRNLIVPNKEAENIYTAGKSVEISRKTFYKEFKKVIDMADVVLQVLDARDPVGSRCQQVEDAVLSSGTNKKLVLVLNKIDLVPRENVQLWLKYLRNEFPTVAFKASTQTQNSNLNQTKLKSSQAFVKEKLLKTSRCLGADLLMKLLGNYCRNEGIKTSITVGVVGLPNTGKSSIINSLKRAKACNVGATPGVTKCMQAVQLDKHIKLIDSPGVVMSTKSTDTAVVLRNCAKVETLQDPISPVEAILKRCNKTQIMLHYKISDYRDTHEFLCLLAKRFGMLKKHGVPQVIKAARRVLTDWTSGKISYYTHPPEGSGSHLSAEIVSSLGTSFNIDDIQEDEARVINSLPSKISKHMLVDSCGPALAITRESDLNDVEDEDEALDEDNSEMEEMEEDVTSNEAEDKEFSSLSVSVVNLRQSEKLLENSSVMSSEDIKEGKVQLPAGNLQLNKERKKQFKHMKKQKKRTDAIVTSLADSLTNTMEIDDDKDAYNFETDFCK